MSSSSSSSRQAIIARLAGDLRCKDVDLRNRAAKELHSYVSSELREVSEEELSAFLDAFTRSVKCYMPLLRQTCYKKQYDELMTCKHCFLILGQLKETRTTYEHFVSYIMYYSR